MELRPYQSEITDTVLPSFSKDLIQLPTGGGKTIVAGHLCNTYLNSGKNVLFLAHREELITQPSEKFLLNFGIDSSIIKGNIKSNLLLNMQIGSVQSYHKRLDFNPDVIVIDEAHHSEAKTYQKIIETHKGAKLIGLTATPYRLNGKGFSDTFDRLVKSKTVKELEALGFLVSAKCFSYPIGHDKLSRIKITGGDYNEQQLEDLMNDRVLIEDIVVSYKQHCDGKKMIVFASSVEHSKAICKRFNQLGVKASHIDAGTKKRDEIIEVFRFGSTDVLCNVGIATEGVDIPEIEAVCLARPTKSLALYLQMCGRGSRPIDGKVNYILLDHANNFWEHGAPNKDHDWEAYFNGVATPILDNNESRAVFKLSIEDSESILLADFMDFEVDLKGFALEEVYLTKDEWDIIFSNQTIDLFDLNTKEKRRQYTTALPQSLITKIKIEALNKCLKPSDVLETILVEHYNLKETQLFFDKFLHNVS